MLRQDDQAGPKVVSAPGGGASPPPCDPPEPRARGSASLYDEIFEQEKSRRGRHRIRVWQVTAGSVFLIAVILFISLPSGSESEPFISIPASPQTSQGASLPATATGAPAATGPLKSTADLIPPAEPPPTETSTPAETSRVGVPGSNPVEPPREPPEPVAVPTREVPSTAIPESKPPLARKPAPEEDEPAPRPARTETPTHDGETETAETGPSEAAIQGFEILKSNSDTVRRLVEGQLDGWTFREWRFLQEREEQLWLDVVAVKATDGQEVHFVWAVDPETGAVRALSQAARDLEARSARSGN